ncbi:hypothetical protein [Paraburkholderia silvatlantica]|uniref:hypothetical protein n=1 Tax=Paraburkholderia silvatlantica TaxID=321895 RepID=UPI0011B6B952|nr:hypothetical protein [Paraburkholderia silvatlantica]
MAARLRKTHQDDVRAKIQASQLINVLQNHALGLTEDLPASRLKAIEILLKKTLPDLSQLQAEHTGPEGGPLVVEVVRFGVSDDKDSPAE